MATVMTPGSPINSVYFPETGALSEFVLMADGSAVEVGFIGREGMAGWPALFGGHVSGIWVVCQTGGLFLQFTTTELAAEVDRNPELHRRLGPSGSPRRFSFPGRSCLFLIDIQRRRLWKD